MEYFSANLRPSLVSSLKIHTSHQEPGASLLDDFEQTPHDVNSNTTGEAVTGIALSTLAEDALRTLDIHSPHITSGGDIAWQSVAGKYVSLVPSANKDVSSYAVLAFRVTQKYGTSENPPNQPQDLFVRLTDGGGKSRAIRVSTFTDVPFPYERGFTDMIKIGAQGQFVFRWLRSQSRISALKMLILRTSTLCHSNSTPTQRGILKSTTLSSATSLSGE